MDILFTAADKTTATNIILLSLLKIAGFARPLYIWLLIVLRLTSGIVALGRFVFFSASIKTPLYTRLLIELRLTSTVVSVGRVFFLVSIKKMMKIKGTSRIVFHSASRCQRVSPGSSLRVARCVPGLRAAGVLPLTYTTRFFLSFLRHPKSLLLCSTYLMTSR